MTSKLFEQSWFDTNFFSNIFANNSTHCFYTEIWLGCTRHSGVIDTTVTCTLVSMTPQWHVRTAVSMTLMCTYDAAVTLDLIFERLWLPLKVIHIEKIYIRNLSCTIPITFIHYGGYPEIVFLSQQWRKSAISYSSRFSSRIRSHIQKGFNPCIRCLGGDDLWKKPEVENLVSGSL
jgi:hypothetical protein